MSENADPRIEQLYRSDQTGVVVFVVALWVTILFVLYVMWEVIADPNVKIILAVSAGALLLFNSASMLALARHYAEDKDAIYALDLRYRDEAKAIAEGGV